MTRVKTIQYVPPTINNSSVASFFGDHSYLISFNSLFLFTTELLIFFQNE